MRQTPRAPVQWSKQECTMSKFHQKTFRHRTMLKAFAGGVLLCVLPCCLPCAAQQQPAPALQLNAGSALRAFEPGANEPYQLGRGDDIHVEFAGRPELNSKYTVGPDGRITLPLAGAISIDNLTREQAADAISSALSPYYSRLAVNVGVDKYTSNRILLLGSVQRPGFVSFDRPPSLLEVITRGGTSTPGEEGGGQAGSGYTQGSTGGSGGGGNSGSIHNYPSIPERVAIYRGTEKVMWVDLKGLLDSGSPLADLRLRRDDVVYVPSPSERYVSMLGQIQHPGALLLQDNSTLPKLLAEAGGITDQAGRYPEIQIIQPSTGTTRVISFKQVLQPGPLDLKLKTGDIIYVPESGFNRATYALQRISPLVTIFTAAAFFAQ